MRDAWIAAIALAAIRLAIVGRFELAPDEAYYLTWAHRGAGVDHPPLVGWLARFAWALADRGVSIEVATRVLPVVFGLATSLFVAATTRALGGSRRAVLVAIVLASALPLPAAGAILFTPDAPLSAPWSLGMFGAALSEARVAIAIVALSALASPLAKVSGLLLLPTAWAARRAGGLSRFGTRVLVPVALVLLGTLPLVAPSLGFQLVHAFTSAGPNAALASVPPFPLAGVPIFVAGQIALLGPALFLSTRPATRPLRFALVATLVPLVPVFVSALVRVPEPNWSGPAYSGAIVFFALASDRVASWRAHVAVLGTVAIAIVLHVHLVRPFLPLPPRADTTRRLHGWKAFACEGAALPVEGTPAYGIEAEREVYGRFCGR